MVYNELRWLDMEILEVPSAILNSEMGHDFGHLGEK